jgi:hypothetical protein
MSATNAGAPPGPPPGGPAAPGASPPPPPPARHGGAIAAVVAVIVVVVVVIAVLAIGHIGPFASPATSNATLDYASAASDAGSVANSSSGGPWSLELVDGADVTQSYTETTLTSGCTISGGTGQISLNAYSGNYSNGQLENWLFLYTDGVAGSALAVEVAGGHASEVGVLKSGGSCTITGLGLPPIRANAIDSTRVSSLLLAETSVEAYVHATAVSNASFTLLNSVAVGMEWLVEFTGCSVLGIGGGPSSATEVVADVNATTGAVASLVASGVPVGCSGASPTPIGAAFAVGNPVAGTCAAGDTYATQGCKAGDYIYTLTVESSTVTFGSVAFEVRTATGAVLTTPGAQGFAILSDTGAVAALGATPSGSLVSTGWAFPGSVTNSTALSTLYTITIDMGTTDPAGQGYTFTALGMGAYDGTTTPLALP